MIYGLANGVELERVGNGGAIMLPDGSIGMLNETGADMVDMILGGVDGRDIVSSISREYKIDAATVTNDFFCFNRRA